MQCDLELCKTNIENRKCEWSTSSMAEEWNSIMSRAKAPLECVWVSFALCTFFYSKLIEHFCYAIFQHTSRDYLVK